MFDNPDWCLHICIIFFPLSRETSMKIVKQNDVIRTIRTA